VIAPAVEAGLGLIGIGRPWGYANPVVPPESEAFRLLDTALELGVYYLDTAPSYGASEERLGRWLRALPLPDRGRLTIATKFGEHWDAEHDQPYADHSFDALRRSFDRSLALLGRVDVLQLHKTTPDVLRSDDLSRAWEYALSAGVREIGPSVSDVASAEIALKDARYRVMQLPFNRDRREFGSILDRAAHLRVVVNRPFAMGAMLYGDAPADKREAFAFVRAHLRAGVVLTGTKSPEHLVENVETWGRIQLAAGFSPP
jgi:aryl-alcohol dehydrogenase-like predicted oxidoreductase